MDVGCAFCGCVWCCKVQSNRLLISILYSHAFQYVADVMYHIIIQSYLSQCSQRVLSGTAVTGLFCQLRLFCVRFDCLEIHVFMVLVTRSLILDCQKQMCRYGFGVDQTSMFFIPNPSCFFSISQCIIELSRIKAISFVVSSPKNQLIIITN